MNSKFTSGIDLPSTSTGGPQFKAKIKPRIKEEGGAVEHHHQDSVAVAMVTITIGGKLVMREKSFVPLLGKIQMLKHFV